LDDPSNEAPQAASKKGDEEFNGNKRDDPDGNGDKPIATDVHNNGKARR